MIVGLAVQNEKKEGLKKEKSFILKGQTCRFTINLILKRRKVGMVGMRVMKAMKKVRFRTKKWMKYRINSLRSSRTAEIKQSTLKLYFNWK